MYSTLPIRILVVFVHTFIILGSKESVVYLSKMHNLMGYESARFLRFDVTVCSGTRLDHDHIRVMKRIR